MRARATRAMIAINFFIFYLLKEIRNKLNTDTIELTIKENNARVNALNVLICEIMNNYAEFFGIIRKNIHMDEKKRKIYLLSKSDRCCILHL